MNTIKEFKNKFRTICTNDWEDALDAWFEAVGQMYVRKIAIPAKYKFEPGLSSVLEKDNPFHYDLLKKNKTNDIFVTNLAEYLYRYLLMLQKYKK